jgi:hypothetical protein
MFWLHICHQDGRFQRKIQAIATDFLMTFLGLMVGMPYGIAIKTEKSQKL